MMGLSSLPGERPEADLAYTFELIDRQNLCLAVLGSSVASTHGQS